MKRSKTRLTSYAPLALSTSHCLRLSSILFFRSFPMSLVLSMREIIQYVIPLRWVKAVFLGALGVMPLLAVTRQLHIYDPSNQALDTRSAHTLKTVADIPCVHFLFMLKNQQPHPSVASIWKAFFHNSRPGTARAFVHCAVQGGCNSFLFPIHQVDTVNSTYCFDLVSPMVRLLVDSLKSSKPSDVFVFLSGDAVPIKSFDHVYQTLTYEGRNGSFCTSDVSQWVRRNSTQPFVEQLFVKHSQWVTLSHVQAFQVVQAYKQETAVRLQFRGCLDEFFFAHHLFGTVKGSSVELNRYVNSCSLGDVLCSAKLAHTLLGVSQFCDTLSLWEDRGEDRLLRMNHTRIHRQAIVEASKRTIETLASIPFLFMRKWQALNGPFLPSEDLGVNWMRAF
jgi:hypothetical protein